MDLHALCQLGSIQAVQELLAASEHALDLVDSRDSSGQAPLHKACRQGHAELAVFLIEEMGSDLEARDNDGNTPLLLASQAGKMEVVVLLLQQGASPEERDDGGRTALILASMEGKDEVVFFLLVQGAKIEAVDNQGRNALMIAASEGQKAIVALLLEKGSNINATDNQGISALMWASSWGHKDIVQLLLVWNASIDSCSLDGSSALMWASDGGHIDIVRLLLDFGADCTKKDNKNKTTFARAFDKGHMEIVDLIQNWETKKHNTGKFLCEEIDAQNQIKCPRKGQLKEESVEHTFYSKKSGIVSEFFKVAPPFAPPKIISQQSKCEKSDFRESILRVEKDLVLSLKNAQESLSEIFSDSFARETFLEMELEHLKENAARTEEKLHQKLEYYALQNRKLEVAARQSAEEIEQLEEKLEKHTEESLQEIDELHVMLAKERSKNLDCDILQTLPQIINQAAIEKMDEEKLLCLETLLKDFLLKIENKKADIRSKEERCCICYENRKSVVFLPCRHLCTCKKCMLNSSLAKCPICCCEIQEKIEIF